MEIANKLQTGFQNAGYAIAQWFQRLGKWLNKTFLHPSQGMITFYGLLIVSNLCWIFTWVQYNCTIPLSGDYVLQSMTFIFNAYDDWHTFFRTGVFPTWDRTVFLGIDNIGGNSFYYLFDPFLLILLPFPREWLLQLQGLEYVLKNVLAGMFFYWYLGDLDFSPSVRRIGALTYAFNAYCFSYLWFQFIDSVTFLPLILLGIERIIRREDPRIFLIGFFLQGLCCYFMFVEYMFGAFFYAMFRFFQTIKERDLTGNFAVLGMGVLSFVVAIFLGCITLIPGIVTALDMPRVSGSSYLSNILNADSFQEMLDAIFTFKSGSTSVDYNQVTPLLDFLFMADDCYSNNLLNVYWYDNYVAGLYATTPMLLLFFVSLFDAFHEKKPSYIIAVFLVCFLVFTPVGLFLFSAFTVGYARYYIIPISWMIVFDLKAIENRRRIPRSYLDLSLVVTATLMAVACYLIIYEVNLHPNYFATSDWDDKMLLVILSICWLFVCYLVMRPFFHKKQFNVAVYLLSALDIIVMANATIYGHGISTAPFADGIDEETKIVQLLKESENNDDYYRIYNTTANRGNINISMREGYTGLGAFHSVYAFSTQDFLDRSRIPYSYQNWSMGVHNRRYNLETFLGTKYYLVNRVDEDFVNNVTSDSYTNLGVPKAYNSSSAVSDYDIPYGYVDVLKLTDEQKEELGVDFSEELLDFLASDECDKTLYVNMNFVDFTFAYDTIMNEDWLMSGYNSDGSPRYNNYEDFNEYPLLRYAILENDDFTNFAENNEYNAGTLYMNGKDVTIDMTQSKMNQASTYLSSLLTSGDYVYGSSAPIQHYSLTYSSSKKYYLKGTIYAANWPATESNPSGEYAVCDPTDYYERDCLVDYAKEHPWEYANGIREADYAYDFVSLTDENGSSTAPDGTAYSRQVLYNSKIVLIPVDQDGNATTILPEADPSDPSTGGYISIFDTNNIEWRLYDENDKLISFAKHSYSNYKQAHGYYADRPVAKIIGIVQEGTKTKKASLQMPHIYVQRNSDYQEAIDNLRKEPVTIVSRTDDKIVFQTHYTSDKFVVLNYPKANGWSLYKIGTDTDGSETKTEVDLYKAQGGFIGFEAPQGEYTYSFEYKSPYLKFAMMLTFLGIIITFISCIFFYRRSRRLYRFRSTETLKDAQEKAIKEIKYKHDNFQD